MYYGRKRNFAWNAEIYTHLVKTRVITFSAALPMTYVCRIMTCVSIVLDWGGKHITQRWDAAISRLENILEKYFYTCSNKPISFQSPVSFLTSAQGEICINRKLLFLARFVYKYVKVLHRPNAFFVHKYCTYSTCQLKHIQFSWHLSLQISSFLYSCFSVFLHCVNRIADIWYIYNFHDKRYLYCKYGKGTQLLPVYIQYITPYLARAESND